MPVIGSQELAVAPSTHVPPFRRADRALLPRLAPRALPTPSPITSSRNAYLNATSRRKSYRPDAPPCPAPMLVRSSSRLLSVFRARSRAVHLAGSQYATRGSLSPAVTRMCG